MISILFIFIFIFDKCSKKYFCVTKLEIPLGKVLVFLRFVFFSVILGAWLNLLK